MSGINFRLIINCVNHKKVIIPKAFVRLNLDEEDSWLNLPDQSLLAYERALVHIQDLTNGASFYLFLKNANIIVQSDTIVIDSLGPWKKYQLAGHKVNYKNSLKKVNRQLANLLAIQKLGGSWKDILALAKLEEAVYQLILMQKLNLVVLDQYA